MKKIVIDDAYLDSMLPPVPEAYEQSTRALLDTLSQSQAPARHARRLSSGLVLAIVLMLLLTGVAIAALNWGSLDFMRYTTPEGFEGTNEEAFDLLQPVGQTFRGDAMEVTIVDALYDGRSLIMGWTVKNTHPTEPLFLLHQPWLNGQFDGAGHAKDDSDLFIQPGETITSGRNISLSQSDNMDAETCEVLMDFALLRPTGPLVERVHVDASGNITELSETEVEEHLQAGDVVVDNGRHPVIGSRWPDVYDTNVELYEKSGLFTLEDTLQCRFTVTKNVEKRVGIPMGGRTEANMGLFTVRLLSAEITPLTATIATEIIYPDKGVADMFYPGSYVKGGIGPVMLDSGFMYMNEHGNSFFGHCSWDMGTTPLEAMPDGTYRYIHSASFSEFVRPGKVCHIIPIAASDTFEHPFTNEGISVSFPKE